MITSGPLGKVGVVKRSASVFKRRDHLVVMSWTGGRPNAYCTVLPATVPAADLGNAVVRALEASESLPGDPPAEPPRHAQALGFTSWRGFARGAYEVLVRTTDGEGRLSLSPAAGPKFEPIRADEREVSDRTPAQLGQSVLDLFPSA